MAKVIIPSHLQSLAGNSAQIEVQASNIRELLRSLEGKYPQLYTRLCDREGNLNKFINFYVNEEDIRFLDKEKTRLNNTDIIYVIPPVAGG